MERNQKSGIVTALGIASVVFGIMILILSFVPCVGAMAMIYSSLPLILGAIGYFIAKNKNQDTGMCLGGLILSLLAFLIGSIKYYNILVRRDIFGNKIGDGNIILIIDLIVIIGIILFFYLVNQTKTSENINENVSDTIKKVTELFSLNKQTSVELLCPTCKNQLSNNDVFCSECGSNVKSYIHMATLSNCPNCNNNIEQNDIFCSECGYNLKKYKESEIQNIQSNQITVNNLNTCSRCASEYTLGDLFCENCGNKLT